ncbi:uncharacterized protein JCM6883_002649 [Sporobolomyces salmoneus]|uniref:uncharacterized protein n=1 Tax=Sporobolomyces salmoneus TaxID=183962 RepID=UPI00316D3AB8
MPSLEKFAVTVQQNSSLGALVSELDISQAEQRDGAASWEASSTLMGILHRDDLPSLRSLSTCSLAFAHEQLIQHSGPISQRLTKLTYHHYRTRTLFLNEDLEELSQLVNLKHLEIRFTRVDLGSRPLGEGTFDQIDHLELVREFDPTSFHWNQAEEEDQWGSKLAQFINRCPRITRLTLSDLESSPGFGAILPHLDSATNSLKTLFLRAHPREPDILSRLAYPPSYLSRLPRLRSLRLGPDSHWSLGLPTTLLPLFEGLTRIVTLKNVFLDIVARGTIGKRIDPLEALDNVNPLLLKRDGWHVVNYDHWKIGDLKALIQAAQRTGVGMGGTGVEACDVWDAFKVEGQNRLALRRYQQKSMDNFDDASDEWPRGWLENEQREFERNFKNFDLQNLKLVKIDLPEEGWFQLTLE